ncbi:MAG TPA: hypothetical protein PKU91_04730, partial [Phycisphaerales bacterium]|nr:hypothetical protein [Phycisphaerales bacterium]
MNRGYPDRHLVVIFGATGDLAHRKLIPALHEIEKSAATQGRAIILGVARASHTDDQYRRLVIESLGKSAQADPRVVEWVNRSIFFQSLGDQSRYAYEALRVRIEQIERSRDLPGNRIFYLALPLPAFAPTVESLGAVGLDRGPGWTRVVIEKPFGHDLASAVSLNALLHRHH